MSVQDLGKGEGGWLCPTGAHVYLNAVWSWPFWILRLPSNLFIFYILKYLCVTICSGQELVICIVSICLLFTAVFLLVNWWLHSHSRSKALGSMRSPNPWLRSMAQVPFPKDDSCNLLFWHIIVTFSNIGENWKKLMVNTH